MAVSQPTAKPSASKSDAPKKHPPHTEPEKRDEVDEKTAAKNRAAFFKKS